MESEIKITGFVAVGMDALKTPEMKICIANAFAIDSRLAIMRSEMRQTMAAAEGLNMGLLAMDVGEELEVPGEVIPVGNDPAFAAFAAFRDPENSDSDDGDDDGDDIN